MKFIAGRGKARGLTRFARGPFLSIKKLGAHSLALISYGFTTGGFPNDIRKLTGGLSCGNNRGRLNRLGAGTAVQHSLYLAVVAGFLGTIIAGVVRNMIMTRAGAGPDT